VGKLARAGHSVAIAFQDEEKNRSIGEIIKLTSAQNQANLPITDNR